MDCDIARIPYISRTFRCFAFEHRTANSNSIMALLSLSPRVASRDLVFFFLDENGREIRHGAPSLGAREAHHSKVFVAAKPRLYHFPSYWIFSLVRISVVSPTTLTCKKFDRVFFSCPFFFFFVLVLFSPFSIFSFYVVYCIFNAFLHRICLTQSAIFRCNISICFQRY